MRHEHDTARRHAYNTLAEVNRHLSNPKITRSPRRHQMLTDMKEKALRSIAHLDDIEDRRDYSDTTIGFGAENRHRGRPRHYTHHARMEMPHDDFDGDMDMRHKRSRHTGRFIRGEHHDDMDMKYDEWADNIPRHEHERHVSDAYARGLEHGRTRHTQHGMNPAAPPTPYSNPVHGDGTHHDSQPAAPMRR